MRNKVTKAVFPVAGFGTRFLPATKSVPKEILPLVDKPLIQYAIDEARAAGIKEFIFVTSRGKSALEDYFDSAPELEKALEELRKGGLKAQAKLSGRSANEGRVGTYVSEDGKEGALVALRCETDPVAKTHRFKHIFDQLVESFKILRNLRGYLPEHRHPVYIYW
jgi:UTP--glucose-1-phosphate uridylyltransferase